MKSASLTTTYDTLLFLAGDSDIAGLLGYLQQHVEGCFLAAAAEHCCAGNGPAPPNKLATAAKQTKEHVLWAERGLVFVQRMH